MRAGRRKEKIVIRQNSLVASVVSTHAGNGIAMSSPPAAGVPFNSNSTKQQKPSYNACPPPANLYGSSSPPAVSYSEKVKASPGASGSSSDGEKKGRRRPGRKSRQVSDSSAFPLVSNETSVPAGTSEGGIPIKQHSQEFEEKFTTLSNLPSPSPTCMPNPRFKIKSSSDPSSNSLFVAKSISRSESKNVDKLSAEKFPAKSNGQTEHFNSSSSKSSMPLASCPLDSSCTADSSGVLKAKNKEASSIGTPRLKLKDMGKSSKSHAGPCPKRSSLGIDSKQLSQKGWRMCAPSGTSPSSWTGNVDCPGSSGISCAQMDGDFFLRKNSLEVSSSGKNSDGGSLRNPHSLSESSVLDSPAIYVSGPPDKLVNGGNSGSSYGHGAFRSSYFSEHLSLEEAAEFIEAGLAFRGVLRVNTHNRSEAYVTLEGVSVDILIDGLPAQNRSMEGDVVAVRLNPVSHWTRLKGTNNKQISNTGSDEMNIKVTNPTDVEVGLGTADNVLDAPVDAMEYSPVSGWDSILPSTMEDDKEGIAMAISPVTDSILEIDGRQPTDSDIGHSKVLGDTKEARNGKLEPERSLSETSLANLAGLVESMPGKRPTGKVVVILEKSMRREAVIGYLEVQGTSCRGRAYSIGTEMSTQKAGKKLAIRSGGSLIFVPVDNRFSKMVVFGSGIPEQLSKRFKDGDPTASSELVVAQVEGWKVDSALPRASVKQSLGPGGTIEAQTAAILFENSIHGAEFPESCLDSLPELPWKIPHQEVKKRKDLRKLRIFTIDPPTAKDVDDALSVERLENGNVQIGVHIADVSFFVEPGTALDKEAQNRSTSVYLIQRVLPMLPPLLCEELCSLNPGVDRLAFSVMWNIDTTGNILDQWIGRTIVQSCAKLTYGHAQEMIDGTLLDMEDGKCQESTPGDCLPQLYGEHSWQDVIADVRKLHEVAKRRRESRFDGGALKLENLKLVFALDECGEPYDSMMYQHQDSNFLVEEFMLLANMSVARVISSAFPERALLRRHPEPNVRKLKEFEEFCSKNGFELDTSSSGALHLSLEKMRETFQDDPVLFNILMLYATKPMQLAKYFCTGDLKGQEDDWAHYALAVPLYTHFTSPIRRYPDLIVHRIVAAALEAEKVITNDGLLSGKEASHCEVSAVGSLQCFSGPMVDKDISDTDAAQKALVVAADKHKIPELSELSLVAAHCNERKLASRNVKEASDKLYLWSMLKKKQGVLSNARVLALGPKFMSLYVCKIAMERRIYYDEIEGLNAEWFEATGTLVLNLSSEKVTPKKFSQARGRPQRTVADVALLVNPTDSIYSNSEEETYEDLIREVEDRLAGKIISEGECGTTQKEDTGSDIEVEPAVLPITLRWFSSVPVSIYAIGGENRPLDIAVRLYVSSYAT